MPNPNDQQEEEVVDDRRADILDAFESVEKPPEVKTETAVIDENKGATEDVKTSLEDPKTSTTDKPESTETKSSGAATTDEFDVTKPPQAWRLPQKAKWDKLDPDIRQEIIKRERESSREAKRLLTETSESRQFHQGFTQAISPYMARINSLGVHPVQAVGELMRIDHILSTAPQATRAQQMAKLIQDYDVDVVALDAALSGKAVVDPTLTRVEQMLEQRLAPVTTFITSQQQARQSHEQQEATRISNEIGAMEDNPKYPFFEQVRNSMADLIEVLHRNGKPFTIESVYNTAVTLDPDCSAALQASQTAAAATTQATRQNERAKRAVAASASVTGAPNGAITGKTNVQDRRSAIASALDSVES